MKTTSLLGFIVPLALLFGCGGKVVIDREGGRGGGGAGGSANGGSANGGGSAQGGAGSCQGVDCTGDSAACSCETTCPGEVLRADCKMGGSSTVICECHLDAIYLGTCGQTSDDACTLPGGCCTEYL